MTNPRASIVVPTRGGVARLPHLFGCLRAQTETDWEAIVVVDGDVDDTAALLEALRHELPVTPIVFPENRGRSAALNAGFDAARGDVLIRCDDDLTPGPGYVAARLARHAGDEAGVVGLCRNVYPDTPYARAYGRERDERFRTDAYRTPADHTWRLWGGNVSVTRAIYDRIGPYDTAFRAYGWEDVDWGYRVYTAGIPVTIAPELETDHHIAATTTVVRVTRAYLSGSARRTFDAKHGPHASGSEPSRHGLWNRLVWQIARHDFAELRRRAQLTDERLDHMPRYLAEKQVSLLVEAAALSGTLHPNTTVADV